MWLLLNNNHCYHRHMMYSGIYMSDLKENGNEYCAHVKSRGKSDDRRRNNEDMLSTELLNWKPNDRKIEKRRSYTNHISRQGVQYQCKGPILRMDH